MEIDIGRENCMPRRKDYWHTVRIIKDFIRKLSALVLYGFNEIKVLGQILAGVLISNNMLPFTNAVRGQGAILKVLKTCMHIKTFWFLPFITQDITHCCAVCRNRSSVRAPRKFNLGINADLVIYLTSDAHVERLKKHEDLLKRVPSKTYFLPSPLCQPAIQSKNVFLINHDDRFSCCGKASSSISVSIKNHFQHIVRGVVHKLCWFNCTLWAVIDDQFA